MIMTAEEVKHKLKELNERINSLTTWDDYAQDLQIQYDRLLSEYNELIKEN
jgi:hypothetical protein